MKALSILVIDDEGVICDGCRLVLQDHGHRVRSCMTWREGIDAALTGRFDLILLDMKLPDRDGSELLEAVLEQKPDQRVIVMSGYATVKSIVNSMKKGAIDYLPKPFTDDELIGAVERTQCRRDPK